MLITTVIKELKKIASYGLCLMHFEKSTKCVIGVTYRLDGHILACTNQLFKRDVNLLMGIVVVADLG